MHKEGASLLRVHKEGSAVTAKPLLASGEHSEEPLAHATSQTSHPMHELGTHQQCEEGKAVCKHHKKQLPNGLMTELHFSAINSMKALRKSKYNENNIIILK